MSGPPVRITPTTSSSSASISATLSFRNGGNSTGNPPPARIASTYPALRRRYAAAFFGAKYSVLMPIRGRVGGGGGSFRAIRSVPPWALGGHLALILQMSWNEGKGSLAIRPD